MIDFGIKNTLQLNAYHKLFVSQMKKKLKENFEEKKKKEKKEERYKDKRENGWWTLEKTCSNCDERKWDEEKKINKEKEKKENDHNWRIMNTNYWRIILIAQFEYNIYMYFKLFNHNCIF